VLGRGAVILAAAVDGVQVCVSAVCAWWGAGSLLQTPDGGNEQEARCEHPVAGDSVKITQERAGRM
jgi:hypothetical protein